MTDITHTPAWRKAVEAVQTWFAAQFDGTYGVDADAAARLVSDLLAALAESAEPLTLESAEFKAFWVEFERFGASTHNRPFGEHCLAGLNAARAPLLARIQALEASGQRYHADWIKASAAHLEMSDRCATAERQRDEALERIKVLEAQREQIILAALGGEDAPGVAASLSVQDVEQACRDNMRTFYATSARADCAERQRDAAIEALKPFEEAADSLDETDKDDWHIWEHPAAMEIKVSDLRRASHVLAASHPTPETPNDQ